MITFEPISDDLRSSAYWASRTFTLVTSSSQFLADMNEDKIQQFQNFPNHTGQSIVHHVFNVKVAVWPPQQNFFTACC